MNFLIAAPLKQKYFPYEPKLVLAIGESIYILIVITDHIDSPPKDQFSLLNFYIFFLN